LRPGEVLSCPNAAIGPSGCGTGEGCRYCGAVDAIMQSQMTNNKVTRETRITSEVDGKSVSWDLKITSAPLKLSEGTFYVLSLQDISNEKRLGALERVFFHDILNTAGGLNGLLSILKQGVSQEEVTELINMSESASQIMLDEIMAYRQFRDAENGDIKVNIEKLNTRNFLKSTIERIKFHEVGQNKHISVEEGTADVDFETDKLLLQRVIINLLKNALEASEINGHVKVSVVDNKDKLVFSVGNSSVMPEEVRSQIFQRSFSTKGSNRGIGTYSIRMMVENYLRGKVSFISNETEGTIFKVELNRWWQENPA
jgi:signal transduction histidine kinase